jgi:hypothetical protein
VHSASRRLVIITAIGAVGLVLASGGSGRSSQTVSCSTTAVTPVRLTGIWSANDGATYWIRQVGACVWWAGFSGPLDSPTMGKSFSNVLFGAIWTSSTTGRTYVRSAQWADVPRGGILGTGTLTLLVRSTRQLVKSSSTGSGFSGTVWTRIG